MRTSLVLLAFAFAACTTTFTPSHTDALVDGVAAHGFPLSSSDASRLTSSVGITSLVLVPFEGPRPHVGGTLAWTDAGCSGEFLPDVDDPAAGLLAVSVSCVTDSPAEAKTRLDRWRQTLHAEPLIGEGEPAIARQRTYPFGTALRVEGSVTRVDDRWVSRVQISDPSRPFVGSF